MTTGPAPTPPAHPSGLSPHRPSRAVMRWLRALTLRTFGLFGLAILTSIGFAILAALVRDGALDALDARVELAVHGIDSRPADLVLKTATLIGSNVVLTPALALVIALAIRARQRVVAAVLLIDATVVIAAYSVLKIAFARDRPELFDKVALPSGYSFPSGHSMSAMGIYGVIAAALVALYPSWRRTVWIAAPLLVFAIGLSRIYLGVHWPSDVVGGWVGGVPPLVASVHLIHRRRARDKNLADIVEEVEAR